MIKVTEDYIITADANGYTAKFLTGGKPQIDKETGKETPAFDVVGYYGTIKGAVSGCTHDAVRRRIAKDDVLTLKEAIAEIERIVKRFETKLGDKI